MKTPRNHADLIKAWADGETIEARLTDTGGWYEAGNPAWYGNIEYRIKPEPKPDVVVYSRIVGKFAFMSGGIEIQQLILRPYLENANIKYTFDGDKGTLKSAEVL